VLQVLQSTNQN